MASTQYSNYVGGGQQNVQPRYEYENLGGAGRPQAYKDYQVRTLVAPNQSDFGIGRNNSALDAMMAGYDEESDMLTEKLTSIYDSYQGNAEKFGEDMQPIIDGLEGDLAGLTEWMGGYSDLLNEIKPNMVGATQLDPTANRYREEYVGNVASQADAADAAARREQASQGINPYENTGSQRESKLNRSAAIASASNQAHRDWRSDYNRDLAQEQNSNAMFADLYGKTGDHYGTSIGARTALAGVNQGMYDTTLQAQQAKAAGYENLYGNNQNSRTEALNLGVQEQNARQQQFNNAMSVYNSSDKGRQVVQKHPNL